MVDLKFGYPMAVAAMGMGFASVVSYIYCDALQLVPPATGVDYRFYFTKIFPVGACNALTLYLANSMYFHLSVAFIEMTRAAMPFATMITLWLGGLDYPTATMVKAVLLTAAGCCIAAYGEMRLTAIGGFFALANLTMESVRVAMAQYLLVGCNMHPMQSLKYIAPAGTATLLLASAVLEWPRMRASRAWSIAAGHPAYFMSAACLGLAVNILGVVIIKLASATTLKMLVAVRGPIVVLLGTLLFAEAVTGLELGGYTVALSGFVWYNVAISQRGAPAASGAPGAEGEAAGEGRGEGGKGRPGGGGAADQGKAQAHAAEGAVGGASRA